VRFHASLFVQTNICVFTLPIQKRANYEGTIAELEVSFVPATVKRRSIILHSIVEELERRNFKSLSETTKEDLRKVMQIISDMHPETSIRLVREYARASIRLWNRERSQ